MINKEDIEKLINKNLTLKETTKKNNIIIIYNYLYNNATIYLERKKDIFDDLVSRLAEMQGQ